MAFRDQLTGLFNRRFFDIKLGEEIDRAARYNRDLSLIMCDIDHFKKYNDEFGHLKGDDVLKTVAELLKGSCRSSDTAARYGGEEMAVILPETHGEKAMFVAEKARLLIEKQAQEVAGKPVTVSCGVAYFKKNIGTAMELIAAADKALYKAKESGRNRCVMDL
jgi:diguanylate cyclase (GGDEF)-like protein